MAPQPQRGDRRDRPGGWRTAAPCSRRRHVGRALHAIADWPHDGAIEIRADLVAELEIGRATASPGLWCRSDGRAWPWFRPGRKVEQNRAARVLRVTKGHVSGSIRMRDNPVESINGICVKQSDSCQLALNAGHTGPLLLRRLAPGVYELLDVCTQAPFATWYQRRRGQAILPRRNRSEPTRACGQAGHTGRR